jgi:glyoxylase-like metal-dependent hydrolase (beta-lactamase superfamily II)
MSSVLRRVVACGLAVLAPALAAAQRDFSEIEIKSTHVAGAVYMLEGAGGNIGVSVGPDGILIVDDQFAPLADKIRAALKELGAGQLRFVLNTHWHGDHTGGNAAFGREAAIIAHDNVRKRLQAKQTVMGRDIEPSPSEALPVVTFDDTLSVHWNGEEIRVLHFPASHTDGDSVIFFTGSNVVHMGDNFFNGTLPFVDLDSGGDVEGMARTVETVLAGLPAAARIIPGHGPLAGADELRAFARMLRATIAIVRERIAAGQDLERIKAAGLPDEWASWGAGFVKTEQWIECVHRSLTRSDSGGTPRSPGATGTR